MPTSPAGRCRYCDNEYTKRGITRHLRACDARAEAIAEAEAAGRKPEAVYHLRLQDAWDGTYWLHLEMRGSSSLRALDSYLRSIWLECCGHLSDFRTKTGWGGDEIDMSRRASAVLSDRQEFGHIYDFGTSSHTDIKVMDVREGAPVTEHPIALMARNEKPEVPCMHCEKEAEWLCVECLYETEDRGTLCDEHAETHPHDAYGEPMPIVNSPRTGMCGYEGPAEPPY
jgi:hypothetical protein